MVGIHELLALQNGIIARRQVEAAGETAADIARRLRRREWVRLLPGVYVDHTGEPAWIQRAWAGVLYYQPAVLADESVLAAAARPEKPVVIAVERRRSVRAREGYTLRWVAGLDAMSLVSTSPPRMRIEDAALRTASRCSRDTDAIQVVADVVRRRQTTGERLEGALTRHPRLPRRRWLGEIVRDVASGTHSVLEREYLNRVERPHGLPPALRQSRLVGHRVRYADADYAAYDVEIELDGWLVHRSGDQRRRDLERDLDAAVAGRLTVRLGWSQVIDLACSTAMRVGALLAARGWTGRLVRCGPGCLVP